MYLRIELSCTLLNVLMPVVVDRLISWKGGIILEASIFKLLLNINVSVQLLHFSLALPIACKEGSSPPYPLVPPLPSLMQSPSCVCFRPEIADLC